MDDSECGEIRAKAVRLLARREYSRQELTAKLAQRGRPPTLVERVVEELADAKLQSDDRFVESYVRRRIEKGYGPRRIRAELRERGIGVASGDLDTGGRSWQELAAAARVRKFGAARIEDQAERARQIRFLEYRGFEHEHIRAALGAVENDIA